MCIVADCKSTALYNFPGEKSAYCSKHREVGMINMSVRHCQQDGCFKRPTYNNLGETIGLYCLAHKHDGMIDVKNKRCQQDGCITRPTYNTLGGAIGLYCLAHKRDGMIDVKNRHCQQDGCIKQPAFNNPGETTGLYCSAHKHDEMINVVSRRCQQDGCIKHPAYNNPGEMLGLYCSTHKHDGMINVISRRCQQDGCIKHPTYNNLDETAGLYCLAHKHDGMINVISRRCQQDECIKIPNFNNPGETIGLYCSAHKHDGMIDVKNKRCQQSDCSTQPRFGLPGNAPIMCAKHKLLGMIIHPSKKCEKCKEIALYGATTAKRCEAHKEPTDKNLIERECESCHLPNILDDRGYCYACDPNVFNIVRLAKQTQVKQWLDAHEHNDYESYDTIIRDGCDRERPDFLFKNETDTVKIVLEVDEHQHKDRPELCECTRMVNISQQFGGLPVIFLRYNPDNFKVGGIKQEVSFIDRMTVLELALRTYKKCNPEKLPGLCTLRKLFFDEWIVGDTQLHVVTEFE